MSTDDTPPRGSATYTLVDIGEMAKRAADNSHETKATMYELKGIVMRHDSQLAELIPLVKVQLAPRAFPAYLRIAAVLATAALLIMAYASIAGAR